MKQFIYSVFIWLTISPVFSQEESTNTSEKVKSDTSRTVVGKIEIITVNDKVISAHYPAVSDTIDASPSEEEIEKNEAHWSGLELGVNALLNAQNTTNFSKNPYWENDPAQSFSFNLNFAERKFDLYKHYVGVTTGLGINFNQFAFTNNYVLQSNKDSVFGVLDTVYNYSKNKLKACYLQVPLLVEFNTKENSNKSFYLAAGLIGGIRLASKTKREGEVDGKNFEQKVKGVYSLNSFKVDATVRVGYAKWGAFATYSLIPLFETTKTVAVHPFTVGLTHSF